jgi:phosphate ABC transporter phosphate-binding protein
MSARRWHPARVAVAILGVALVTLGIVQVAAPAGAAIGTVHAPIRGSGSSWSGNMLDQWVRNVYANYGWTVTYSGTGSTVGRNEFATSQTQFGGTDIPYAIENSNENDIRPARGFAYMPIVAGGTSFMYNLKIAGKRVTNLRLSGESISKIFTGVITQWNDPQIASENPLLALPAIPIVPVVRSDGAGETAQFTMWMRQEYPSIWDAYCAKVGRPSINGHCGITSNYPVVPGAGFLSAGGSNQVAAQVAAGSAVGAIGPVQYSYALNTGFPVAKMLNKAGYYTEPTAPNVAVALLAAQINYDKESLDYLTQDLRDVYVNADARTYPLSSYSYVILPTKSEPGITDDQGLTLADFSAYFLCEGQQQAPTLGYSPLPINLVKAGQEQIEKIPGGNPVIKGITDCNNPTFDPDGSNRLAKTAPYPPECDKAGPTQCLTGTGGAQDTPTDGTSQSGGAASGGPTNNDPAATSGDGGTVTQAEGDSVAVAADAAPVLISATPQTLPVATIGVIAPVVVLVAGAALFAAAVLPPLLGRRRRRKLLLPVPTRGSPR